MPLLAQVGCVHDAFAVRRKVRPGLPGSFFVMDFARLGSRFGFHAPEATGAVNVIAIRNVENLRAVWRPHRVDLVIKLAVVVAWQGAASFSREALQVLEFAIT